VILKMSVLIAKSCFLESWDGVIVMVLSCVMTQFKMA